MYVYPLGARELESWRSTLVRPGLTSRHLLLIFLVNFNCLIDMFLLGRSCLRTGVPIGIASTGACIVVAAVLFAGYYEFQLHRHAKMMLAGQTLRPEQEKQILTMSYIAFRLYFVLVGIIAVLLLGIASIWPR